MYRGEGRDDASSSCRYVLINGGKGISWFGRDGLGGTASAEKLGIRCRCLLTDTLTLDLGSWSDLSDPRTDGCRRDGLDGLASLSLSLLPSRAS